MPATTVTATRTRTYTRTDIGKVFEILTSELRLIARSTSLWTLDYAQKVSEDIVAFAEEEYLCELHIVLSDDSGQVLRVHEYKVSTDASGWERQGPRGNVWPQAPGGRLNVILFYSAKWGQLEADARASFKSRRHLEWSPTSIDTRYPGLSPIETRTYASQAFGLARASKARGS